MDLNSTKVFFISGSWKTSANKDRLESLANALIDRGYHVVIILDGNPEALPAGTPSINFVSWPSSRPTKLRDAFFLLKLIHKFKPVCLISQFGSVNVMTLIGWLCRVPYRMVRYETLSNQIESDTDLPPAKFKWFRFRKKIVLRLATNILSNSMSAAIDARLIYTIPEEKVHIFYNYLPDPLKSDPTLSNLEPIQGRIVCVGRFSPTKGQDILIKALSMLTTQIPISVEFVGKGESLEACKQLAQKLGVSDRCLFSGSVPHNYVFHKFATAACSVVPSRNEAFGYVCIESLSVSTPVIGSRVGGIPEIVRDGVEGFLFDPGDEKDLACKIDQFFASNNIHATLRTNSRQRFLDSFETSVVANQQAEWLINHINQRKLD